jgi:hypothetical protein
MSTLTARLRNHIRQAINNLSSSTELTALLEALDTRTGTFHVPIAGPSQADGPPGTAPDVAADGALSYLHFNGPVGVQKAYRVFKVPTYFVGDPQFHVHWTKSDDVDRSTETVRWRVGYTVFDGSTEDGDGTPTYIDFDDSYDDAGTTTRIVHRTANAALSGVQPGYYVAVSVEKGTPPSGTPMAEPGVVSVDFTFTGYATRNTAP